MPADFSYGPTLVLDEATLAPAANTAAVLSTAVGQPAQPVYDLSGQPRTLTTNAQGYLGGFRADIALGVLSAGSVAVPVISLEAQESGAEAAAAQAAAEAARTAAETASTAAQAAAATAETPTDTAVDAGIVRAGAVTAPKVFQTVNDATVDQTASLRSFLASLVNGDFAVIKKVASPVLISGTLTMPSNPDGGVTIFAPQLRIKSTVTNAPVIQMGHSTRIEGFVRIDCQDAVGSVGVQYGGLAGVGCTKTSIERIHVYNPDGPGIRFTSTSGQGTYYNHIGDAHVRYGDSHGIQFDSQATVNETNSNYITFASVQNCLGDAVHINGADGNGFGFLEAESNAGWAVRMLDGKALFIAAGWFEGNTLGSVSLADFPAVAGTIDILTQMDGTLAATVAVTYSGDRSVRIGRGNDKNYHLGFTGMATLDIGANGTAGPDQSPLAPLLRVAGKMLGFRNSTTNKNFETQIAGGTTTDLSGWRVLDEAGNVIAWFDKANGLRMAGQTLKSMGGGLDIAPAAANQNVRFLTSGTGKVLVNGPAGVQYAGAAVDLDGTGTPEGIVTAVVGSTYRRRDGGAGTCFYVKESGAGTNTGWIAK